MKKELTLIKADNLKAYLGVNFDIFIKREDLSYYGSHKGRSIPIMISEYWKKGFKKFVISSSGNAALAAAIFIRDFNLTGKEKMQLKIFIGKNIPWNKYRKIKKIAKQDKNIHLEKIIKPKQSAFLLEKNSGFKNLRQSTDELALIGYEDLAREIHEQVNRAKIIFVPASSGTTAVGLYNGFKKIGGQAKIFFVQTDFCHPFISSGLSAKKSLAAAIVDIVGHRKPDMKKILKNQGGGYVATDKEIKKAIKIIKKTEKIKISANSALSIVGLLKLIESGKKIDGPVVCVLTGN